jgi:hypothetical protein
LLIRRSGSGLARAVARAEGAAIGYLHGLAMRRFADLHRAGRRLMRETLRSSRRQPGRCRIRCGSLHADDEQTARAVHVVRFRRGHGRADQSNRESRSRPREGQILIARGTTGSECSAPLIPSASFAHVVNHLMYPCRGVGRPFCRLPCSSTATGPSSGPESCTSKVKPARLKRSTPSASPIRLDVDSVCAGDQTHQKRCRACLCAG